MGKKKQETRDTQTYTNSNQSGSYDNTSENEIGFAQVPTADWAAYKGLEEWNPTADPTISSRFGARRQRAMSSFNNLAGPYATPELTAARLRNLDEEIGQEEGAAYAADAARMNEQQFAKRSTLAGLSAPISYNKKSRSYGTSTGQTAGSSLGKEIMTQPGRSIFGSILGGIGTAASAFGGGFI